MQGWSVAVKDKAGAAEWSVSRIGGDRLVRQVVAVRKPNPLEEGKR